VGGFFAASLTTDAPVLAASLTMFTAWLVFTVLYRPARVAALAPNAVDAGSREALFNLVNGRIDRRLARLDAGRAERRAISRVLLGMAAEELVRRKTRLDADWARADQARTALALAFAELTGRAPTDYELAASNAMRGAQLRSTVGRVDLGLDDGTDQYSTGDGTLRTTITRDGSPPSPTGPNGTDGGTR
jgi:hypothetical protein